MATRKSRPTDKSTDGGPFIVQLKDKQIPGVYHWVCHCWTMEDAEMIANLLMDKDAEAKAFIQVTYELR